MRLLNVQTRQLENFLGDPPPYLVLSHTWGPDEITLQDLEGGNLGEKLGWIKITGFINTLLQRVADPIEYVWVDTCCIDKTSSAELSEAINAMFLWYKHSECCYAYLDDVELDETGVVGPDFEGCRWFERGWTLQELIAPRHVEFFDRNWKYLGSKHDLAERISLRTNIDEKSLLMGNFMKASVSKRMSWVGDRQTTRPEDLAYCLLGIFDINMPMLYGEGERAFIRLQEEILKEYDDQSIFAWDSSDVSSEVATIGFLATHPSQFKGSSEIESYPSSGEPLAITNKGIQLDLTLIQQQSNPGQVLGMLSCITQGDVSSAIGVPLIQSKEDKERYSRSRSAPVRFGKRMAFHKPQRVYLTKRNSSSGRDGWATTCWLRYGRHTFIEPVKAYPPTFWHQSPFTPSMTMTIPYATCASSPHVSAAVGFRSTKSDDCFALLLHLRPQQRTMSFSLAAIQAVPEENELAKLLRKMVKNQQGEKQTLELSIGTATAVGTVQLARGAWMYDMALNVIPRDNKLMH